MEVIVPVMFKLTFQMAILLFVAQKQKIKNCSECQCGGMGLTGFIIRAKIKMIFVNSFSIKQNTFIANNLSDLFLIQ